MVGLLTLALAAGVLAACGANQDAQTIELRGAVMGTTWSVRLAHPPNDADVRELAAGIERMLAEVDGRMSTWKPTSEVSRFNANPTTDWLALSPATVEVLQAARDVSMRSRGAFDVTVGPLVDAWGFGSEPRAHLPTGDELARLREDVGWQKLDVRGQPPSVRKAVPGVRVDLSALAKGYAIDRVVALLEARGYRNALVELGGEVAARGRRTDGMLWRVGIERPVDGESSVHRTVRLANRALATSGDYRRYVMQDGRRLSHVVDPRTGRPVRHQLASATVIAPNAMEADAWATALMVLGPQEGLAVARREQLDVLLLSWRGSELIEASTPGFARLIDRRAPEPATHGMWLLPIVTMLILLLTARLLLWRHASGTRPCARSCEGGCPGNRASAGGALPGRFPCPK
jgi:thiamine biosynthesis lipoprotein